jgi:hypothetical protein
MKLEFSGPTLKGKAQTSSFIKIRPLVADLFDAKRERERETTKLMAAFRNFAHAPKTAF